LRLKAIIAKRQAITTMITPLIKSIIILF
jgi:hypothetical protein